MATKLIKCKTCGEEISSDAKTCPKCGAKIKKISTLGIVLIVIAVIVVIAAIASNASNGPEKEVQTKTSEAEKTNESQKEESNVFKINETAVFQKIKVSAEKMEVSEGKDFFTPESGKVFVGVNFIIENVSNEDVTISSLLLFDCYCDDLKCDYSFSAACAFSDGTIDGTISPGKKLNGWYAVEVPENWEKIEMQIKQDWLQNSKHSAKFIFENS